MQKPTATERKKSRKRLKAREKKKDKLYSSLFIACIILYIVHYTIKPTTIGHDIKYIIFIYALPFLACIGFVYYKRNEILDMKEVKATPKLTFVGYSIIGVGCIFIFSIMTLGLFVDIGFTTINYYYAKRHKQETIILPVDQFHKGTGSKATHSIYFNFKGEIENLTASREYIEECITESATKKHIRLELRKGIWNHYLVDDFDIIR